MTDLLKKRTFIFEYIKYIYLSLHRNQKGIANHP